MTIDHLRIANTTTSPSLRAKHLQLHNEALTRDAILNCHQCPLARTRTQAVPWSGPTSADIVLMGEGPGAREDAAGVPFVGQAGRMLDGCLDKAGVAREQVMVVNAVNCRPPENRTPNEAEIAACSNHRIAQLNLTRALVVVTLGKTAYQAMTGWEKSDGQIRMGNIRGQAKWVDGFIVIPTWHPAYVLRNRDSKFQLERDLRLAVEMVWKGKGWPQCEEPEDCVPEWTEEQRERFRARGWLVVKSHVMGGELVCVVRDENVRVGLKRADRTVSKLPRFTLEELMKVREIGKRRGKGVVAGSLRALIWVKEELGGTVIL